MGREPLPPEALLKHMGFLRALGSRLLLDSHTIDDATQSTMAVGLEQGPRDPAKARGWLARVFRNAAGQSRRADGRRRRREQRVSSRRSVESTVDAAARHEVMQRVADAVSALAEPYRETVLLRFYDGLPPRKIAEQTGAPVTTVKSRLARAMKQLRATLDEKERGGGRAWRLALAPLAGIDPASVGHAAMGAATMKAKTTTIAAAAAVLAIGGTVALLDPFSGSSETDPQEEPMRVAREEGGALESGRETPPKPEDPITADEDKPEMPPGAHGEAPKDPGSEDADPERSPPGKGVAGNSGDASRLDTKVQALNLEGTSVRDAIDYLANMTGVEMVVSDGAEEAMQVELSMTFRDTPLKDILNTLTKFTECSFTERSGIVYIEK